MSAPEHTRVYRWNARVAVVAPPPKLEPRDARRLENTRLLVWLLDSAFRVPGTRWRFGFDPVIGLVPGLGDLVGAVLSFLVIWNAVRLGVPRRVQLRMALNVLAYAAIGTIPVVGDGFDFFFKANRRNYALLERALAGGGRATSAGDRLILAALALLVLSVLGAVATLLVAVAWSFGRGLF